MKLSKFDRLMVEKGKAEVLAKVEKFEDLTFAHICIAEKVLEILDLDSTPVMEAVMKKRKQ